MHAQFLYFLPYESSNDHLNVILISIDILITLLNINFSKSQNEYPLLM